MSSLHTNQSALSAHRTLRGIDASMSKTQIQASSGLRTGKAEDNAAYWSIATTMRSDRSAMSAVQDALGLGAATVDTAYMGMSNAIEVMDEIKSKLVAAREPGVDRDKINSELTELKSQIRSISSGASFSGQNWLQMDSADQDGPKQVVGSFVRDAAGNVSVKTLDYDMTSVWDTTQVFYLVDDFSGDSGIVTNSAFADELGTAQDWVLFSGYNHPGHAEITLSAATAETDIDDMISVVEAMMAKMTDNASILGALQARISIQLDFADDLVKGIDKGVGRLVDADMNTTSTRLKALQTQQQLGTQALTIANGNADNIMKLFG